MLTTPPPHAAATEELFHRAEAALRRILAAEPRNAAALARLGDLERRRGDFAAALTAYRRLLAVAPDDASAAWAVAVLDGDRLPEAPPAGRIAPFARLTDFLPPASRERLLREVPAASERFAPAKVGEDAKMDREVRNALVLDEPATRAAGRRAPSRGSSRSATASCSFPASACTRSPPWRAAPTSETGASRSTAGSTAFGGAHEP